MTEITLQSFVEKKVPGLFFIILIFAMIEFSILIICLLLSGNQDVIKVYNSANILVYEGNYDTHDLNHFKRVSEIKNFKEEGYIVTRAAIENKFPTRGWIALSVSVPTGLILFIAFIVRVFEDVFRSKRKKRSTIENSHFTSNFDATRFDKLFSTLSRLNIYALGSTIILIGFFFWMIPDLIIYLGKISYQTVSELKWAILSVVIFGSVYMVIRMFLSHKIKTEIIKQQSEIQKQRDRLTIEHKNKGQLLEKKPVDN